MDGAVNGLPYILLYCSVDRIKLDMIARSGWRHSRRCGAVWRRNSAFRRVNAPTMVQLVEAPAIVGCCM